jgi:hypothetical protein
VFDQNLFEIALQISKQNIETYHLGQISVCFIGKGTLMPYSFKIERINGREESASYGYHKRLFETVNLDHTLLCLSTKLPQYELRACRDDFRLWHSLNK